MRVLYIASAVEANGTSGGATHVSEVACGLRTLGHDLVVIARPPAAGARHSRLSCGVPLRTTPWRRQLALLATLRIAKAIRAFRPHVVMERFYNFAGAGVLAAHRAGIPVLLEVNAPMIDPANSLKSKVDRLLLGSMRGWAVRQGEWSAAIVTPLATTVPPEVGRLRIHELPWGANVDRFDPAIKVSRASELHSLAADLGLDRTRPVAVFLGSFRAWHGVAHFAEAARLLLDSGSDISFLAIGGGPELEPLRERVAGWHLPPGRFVFAGPQPHDRVPDYLALADIGVAPFDLSAHAPLREFGFYWSPLKVFEYMSMGIPVLTIDEPPINGIVRDRREGLLYPTGDVAVLASTLKQLAADSGMRAQMGAAARERVVAHYSWRAHCVALDAIMKQIAHA